MTKRNIGLISAGVAFFAFLAVFPGIAALISVFGLISDPLIIQSQLEMMDELLPRDVRQLLQTQITRLIWANEGALGWATFFSTLFALFLARRGIDAMLLGMNTIHGGVKRSGLKHALAVAAITLGTLLAGVVALLSVLVLPIVLALFPLGGLTGWAIELGRWVLVLGLIALWLWVFYRIGPNLESDVNTPVRPGLLLALGLWIILSMGFSYYLSNFGNYNAIYGSIGAVIALLTWFYLSAYVVMLGGVVNAVLHERRQRKVTEHDAAKLSPRLDGTGLPETE